MKNYKLILLLSLMIFYTSRVFSQETAIAPIQISKSFWRGTYMIQNDKVLNMREAKTVMKVHPLAYQQIRRAKTNKVIALTFACTGGAFLGLFLGAERDFLLNPGWGLLGIGAGFVGVGIPFSIVSDRQMKKAVSLYNNGQNTGRAFLKLGFTGSGIGLTYSF